MVFCGAWWLQVPGSHPDLLNESIQRWRRGTSVWKKPPRWQGTAGLSCALVLTVLFLLWDFTGTHSTATFLTPKSLKPRLCSQTVYLRYQIPANYLHLDIMTSQRASRTKITILLLKASALRASFPSEAACWFGNWSVPHPVSCLQYKPAESTSGVPWGLSLHSDLLLLTHLLLAVRVTLPAWKLASPLLSLFSKESTVQAATTNLTS